MNESISFEHREKDKKQLIVYLSQFINETRLELLQKILTQRTRYITVVLEDIYQSQNASAVLRSCDCFGIQDVHIIENRNRFQVNKLVSLGAPKWLSLNRYNHLDNNTPNALQSLKEAGYRIVATSPDRNTIPVNDFDLTTGKVALVFGSEKPGISSAAESMADEFLTIPMVGFTESLNLSVSAATILYQLTNSMRSQSVAWRLTDLEADGIMLEWMRRNIKKCAAIEARFWKGDIH